MSTTKKFKARAKVAFKTRKGVLTEGRLVGYELSRSGEWATVEISKGKTYKLRPSQLLPA